MSDDLRTYYQNELAFLRKAGEQFARENPKIAERLLLSAENCNDPHVERMIEAFALLTAQVRRKLDDEFPEITDALLNILYPHYLAPVPSVSIVEFALQRAQAGLKDGFAIPRGTMVESEPATGGGPCTYRTCYGVTVYPVEVSAATLRPVMTAADSPVRSAAVLKLVLSTFAQETGFSDIAMQHLRFHLSGQDRDTQLLYELILTRTRAITITCDVTGRQTLLPIQSVRPAGFAEDEAILPATARAFPGYRLLSEYFAFHRKFLFVDLVDIASAMKGCGHTIEVAFHLDQEMPALEQVVSAQMFRLGCTPIVNLFRKKCEPIHLLQTQNEYRVVPDSRSPAGFEVCHIDRVSAISPDGSAVECQPIYSVSHSATPGPEPICYQTVRRDWTTVDRRTLPGGETHMEFSDLVANPYEAPGWIMEVDATCCNRSMPEALPTGVGRPAFHLVDGGPVTLAALMSPTATLRPARRTAAGWRLVSLLALNHDSLLDPQGGPAALREIMELHDPVNSTETRARIASIVAMRQSTVVGRIPGQVGTGWVRGVGLELEFDEDQVPNNGAYLLISVLERFLSMYVSVNSFVRVSASSRKRKGAVWQWPARSADKTLL